MGAGSVDPEQVPVIIRKLKAKPGRGGIRLSYEEAQATLALLSQLGDLIEERRHLRDTLRKLRRPYSLATPIEEKFPLVEAR